MWEWGLVRVVNSRQTNTSSALCVLTDAVHVYIFALCSSLTITCGCLRIGNRAFSRVKHSAYRSLLVALWLCLTLQLSHPTFLFLFLPACVRECVCASWGQDQARTLKSGSLELFCPSDSWLEQLSFLGWQKVPVKYHYRSLTHNLSLFCFFSLNRLFFLHFVCTFCQLCVVLSNSILCLTPLLSSLLSWLIWLRTDE